MTSFVGRTRQFAVLDKLLAEIIAQVGEARPGRCLVLRGQRRIGKSTLVETFIGRANVPAVFYTATGAPADAQLADLIEDVRSSTLPDRTVFDDAAPGNWSAALRQLASTLPEDQPSVVVIDEVPYLMDRVDGFEGILQRSWDRELSRRPILLVLIGSDLSMMEALSSYGRPFHQRGQEMVLGPLNPAEVSDLLQVEPAVAFDAALVTGGLPLICAAWRPGMSLWDFLSTEFTNPVSALLVSAERSLAAEFPDQAYARQVLSAIGSGERTFTNIARATGGIARATGGIARATLTRATGGIAHTTLTRATELLARKRMIAADLPISTRPSKERRYRIADPYLRFWLRFVQPHLPEIERMRGDLVLERVRAGWTAWRGRAVEPLLRESLAWLLPDGKLPTAGAIGGYWTRSNNVEIDIVGADRQPVAKQLLLLGSIKWLEHSPFDDHDLAALQKHRAFITDDPVPLIAISRSGVDCANVDASYGPAELLDGWRRAAQDSTAPFPCSRSTTK